MGCPTNCDCYECVPSAPVARIFNAEGARAMVAEFYFNEEKEVRAHTPHVLAKIEMAARKGHTSLVIDIKYKYIKIISEELKALGFSIKLDCQGRDGDDNTYSISW